ncbi:MAG: ABC transporter permease, partial [Anaerolineae bacterium]|nr:ABC transporter permease [Anaerolineae bacterium]
MQDETTRKSFASRLPFDSHTLRLLVIAVVIFVAFSVFLPGKFFTIRNMQSMAVQFPEFGILAF